MIGEAILKSVEATKAATPLEAVEGLVAEHSRMVFRIAYSILRNHHDAEDAVQDCFLRALKYGKGLNRVRNPKTWLARIAWTAALDRRSARVRLPVSDPETDRQALEQVPDQGISADERIAGQQMRQLLERMIATLPDDLRQPLQLATVRDLNSAEIGETLGIPETSVRTRLMRARNILREKLSSRLEARHG